LLTNSIGHMTNAIDYKILVKNYQQLIIPPFGKKVFKANGF